MAYKKTDKNVEVSKEQKENIKKKIEEKKSNFYKKQEKRIKLFLKKLKPFYENLTPEEQIYAKNLAEEIAFMKITMEDLKEEVNQNGVITEMIQGDYSITRENPALRSYNTTVQRYNSTIKQLDDFINRINPNAVNEESRLINFIQKK